MNNVKKQKTSWLLVGFVSVAVVFAVVGSRFNQPKDATGRSLKQFAGFQSSWDVAFTSSFGREVPDFSIESIDGKTHKLSDYLGSNVMIVFWATWCPPCNLEIPHLIELKNTFSKDKLTILAISKENPEHLKDFAKSKDINYTIATSSGNSLPEPFSKVSSIPTIFFIDAEGKIKFAAVGLVPMTDAMKIMEI